LAYKMASNAQSVKDLFVFRKDFLGNEPLESVVLKPLSKKPALAAGAKRTALPGILERAKARWGERWGERHGVSDS
jgi:hypothetical protein